MKLSCSKKKLFALFREKMSKRHSDFYCLNCLYSFRTKKTNLNRIKKNVKIKIFVILLWSLKTQKTLIKKTNGCQSNLEILPATKVGKHTSSGFSISTILSFQSIRSKYSVCRGKD